jgi:hypothetical protein
VSATRSESVEVPPVRLLCVVRAVIALLTVESLARALDVVVGEKRFRRGSEGVRQRSHRSPRRLATPVLQSDDLLARKAGAYGHVLLA